MAFPVEGRWGIAMGSWFRGGQRRDIAARRDRRINVGGRNLPEIARGGGARNRYGVRMADPECFEISMAGYVRPSMIP